MTGRLTLALALLAVVSLLLGACLGVPSELPPQSTVVPANGPSVSRALTVNMTDGGGRGPFRFQPAVLRFSLGETVEFTFVSESQSHTFTVDGLGINVEVGGAAVADFKFTFTQSGAYRVNCIPHQSLGMVGLITVQ